MSSEGHTNFDAQANALPFFKIQHLNDALPVR